MSETTATSPQPSSRGSASATPDPLEADPIGGLSGPLLVGRRAVVTGGAGGIGAATCALLAEHGADVVVADIDGERTRAVVEDVDKTRSHQVNFYRMPEEYDRFVPVWVPAGHLAEPVEVASVVLFLASELGRWVVGQTIPADGGTLAAGGWYRTPNRWTNSPLLHQYFEAPSVTTQRPPNLR